MPKLLQINITANWGSHGRIAEEIGQLAMQNGWESYIAYGRWANPSKSHLIKIGSMWDERWHGVQSRLLDNHGLASKRATKQLISAIKEIKPDLIHLHNIHGYYLNYPLLFDYLSHAEIPVVWTLHDCWSMTGHCAYFTYAKCEKWKTECSNCENLDSYPISYIIDNSRSNYAKKKKYFNIIRNLTLVPVSDWLSGIVTQSLLKKNTVKVIHNGVDVEIFKPLGRGTLPKGLLNGKKIVLGVSSKWEKRKGLEDFIKLRNLLSNDYQIVIIGLSEGQKKKMPDGVDGICRTDNIDELVRYYSSADVFINPTYEDNFPTTNIEALACGTPVITYRTGGSPEAIDENTGMVVEVGDINGLVDGIKKACQSNHKEETRRLCRERAVKYFNKNDRYKEYLDLYQSLLNK